MHLYLEVQPLAGRQLHRTSQWQGNGNMIGRAGVRDCGAADYPREESACEGQVLGLKPPPGTCALGTSLQRMKFRTPSIAHYVAPTDSDRTSL